MCFFTDSLWPYLQVKQPYLDCETTIRVRLQEPFSAIGEAVKHMIDHAEDFATTGRNIWNAGHRRRTSTDTHPGNSRCVLACLVVHGLHGEGKLAWPPGGSVPAKVRR